MYKHLIFVLFSLSMVWSSHGQIYLDFRNDASIEVSTYWSKAFDLANQNRLGDLKQLTDDLFSNNTNECLILNQEFNLLNAAYKQENIVEIKSTLTQLIVTSIIIDIGQLSLLQSTEKRKEKVISLFREVIAIQSEFKTFDFTQYRNTVVAFRRMNQLVNNKELLEKYLSGIDFISNVIKQC